MESDNKDKSVVAEYLKQNQGQAQSQVGNMGGISITSAPLAKRAMAAIVDRLILLAVVAFFFVLTLFFGGPLTGFLFQFNIIVEFIYAGYFYSTHAATPGKMIFGLQVVTDTDAKLSFFKGGLRDGVGKLISGLILGIGYWMAFFRTDKLALHDIIFKTKVIKR